MFGAINLLMVNDPQIVVNHICTPLTLTPIMGLVACSFEQGGGFVLSSSLEHEVSFHPGLGRLAAAPRDPSGPGGPGTESGKRPWPCSL